MPHAQPGVIFFKFPFPPNAFNTLSFRYGLQCSTFYAPSSSLERRDKMYISCIYPWVTTPLWHLRRREDSGCVVSCLIYSGAAIPRV